MNGKPSRRKKTPKVPPETPKSQATDNPVEIAAHLVQAGWQVVSLDSIPKVLYGMVRKGANYSAVRFEQQKDGTILSLALPENLKAIAADRIVDLMLQEAQ